MRLKVTDPTTGVALFMEAKPDRLHNEQGYRITSPNGSTFFISNRLGTWRCEDSHLIDPLLLANIGIAIEAQEQEDIRPAR
ncbi:hypothetical protein [Arcticibacter sp. MXS-1]|uniref:hypothetical protein n=1 Tax=Arcticibacter sp. MXS-1 TaxID=3341726 RepID=UPI0035A87992